jgi:hypothetical protein
MKKVVALMVIMAVFSTTAFAAPLSVAGSSDTLSEEISLSSQSEADLFADVDSVALTSEEAQAVEGEGWISGMLAAIATVVILVVDACTLNYANMPSHALSGVGTTLGLWVNSDLP